MKRLRMGFDLQCWLFGWTVSSPTVFGISDAPEDGIAVATTGGDVNIDDTAVAAIQAWRFQIGAGSFHLTLRCL